MDSVAALKEALQQVRGRACACVSVGILTG